MPGSMPQGHARTLRETSAVSTRLMVIGFLGLLASIAAIIVALSLNPGRVPRGCISTFLPGPIGAVPTSACGDAARATCSHLRVSPQLTANDVTLLADACRRARLPVASGAP